MPSLDDDQLKRLIDACRGRDLRDRRDEAILRVMIETGLRAGEVVAMQVPDVDLARGTALIRRGMGGKGRTVPIGPHAGRALDRYVRARRRATASRSTQVSSAGTFEDEVDPDRRPTPEERRRRADNARKAFYTALAIRSAQARRDHAAAQRGVER